MSNSDSIQMHPISYCWKKLLATVTELKPFLTTFSQHVC